MGGRESERTIVRGFSILDTIRLLTHLIRMLCPQNRRRVCECFLLQYICTESEYCSCSSGLCALKIFLSHVLYLLSLISGIKNPHNL